MKIDSGLSYLDLFTRPVPAEPANVTTPPAVPAAGRDLIPLSNAMVPVTQGVQEAPEAAEAPPRNTTLKGPLGELMGGFDVRNLSPRKMADISMDLYAVGMLTWDEYSILAFQAELHPDFDKTIGALTGEIAQPDEPRDYVAIWEDRLAFEQRHNPSNSDFVEQTAHVVTVLRQIDSPTDLVA
jgi:hypothetical protein